MNECRLMFFADSTLLEGPVWDQKNNLIYCVSIEQNQVYAINTETGGVRSYPTRGNVGCIAIKNDGKLLVAEKTGIYEVDVDTGSRDFIAGDYSDTDMRYNDGKLDPAGDLLVGIKGDSKDYQGEGFLFCLKDGCLRPVVGGTTIANGLGFNDTGDIMYFIDTPTREVGMYRYDAEKKEAVYLKPAVKIIGEGKSDGKPIGLPDGLCVDLDGNLWVAEWGGAKVCKWNAATGEKMVQIDMPVTNVTSCCLGGKDLEYLYITTAKSDKYEPMAGGLFQVRIR